MVFFIPMGQIRGKGRGEGFTGAWSTQFNKKRKFNNHTINSKTHIRSVTVDKKFVRMNVFYFNGTGRRRGFLR